MELNGWITALCYLAKTFPHDNIVIATLDHKSPMVSWLWSSELCKRLSDCDFSCLKEALENLSAACSKPDKEAQVSFINTSG